MSKQTKLDAFATKETIAKTTEKSKEIRQLYTLPEKWKWASLSELLIQKPQYGLTARSESRGQVLYIRITDIDNFGRLKSTDLRYVKIDKETFVKYAICPGDILIARSGATAGKAFLCKNQMNAVFASYLIRFRVDTERILPEYLFYFLHSNIYWEQLRSWKVGGAQPNVNAQNLKRLKIPLAPIDEQKRIVSRLEQLIGRVEEAKRLRKAAKEETEKIMQAALNKIFNKAEERGWKQVKIGEICKINPSIREIRNLPEDIKVTFVPMSAVDELTGEIENPEIRLLKEVRKGYTYFREGDVLFAKITPCMENGKSAIAKNLVNGIGFGSTEFHVLRPIKEKVTPEWIYYFIRQKSFRDEAARNMTGSVGQQRVPVQFLKNAKIPLPPPEEQKKAVTYLDKLKKTTEIIRKLQFETEDKLEKLVPAILDKAFKGEL